MRDTWLDRTVHRRLSRPVSAAAVRFGVTANQLSLGSLAAGLTAAVILARARPEAVAPAWGSLVLYLVAVVLDHADGEVARRTATTSRVGHLLDLAVDTTVHAAIALAMGVAADRSGAPLGAVLGAGAVLGIVASAALATLSRGTPGPEPASDRLQRGLELLANRGGFYVMLVAFVLVLGLATPPWLTALLVVVTLGSHGYCVAWMVFRSRTRWRARKMEPAVTNPENGRWRDGPGAVDRLSALLLLVAAWSLGSGGWR